MLLRKNIITPLKPTNKNTQIVVNKRIKFSIFRYKSMEKPIRVQRKRTPGFKLPENTVCVTRGTKWGNPFKVGVDGDAKTVVEMYRLSLVPYRNHRTGTVEEFFTSKLNIEDIQRELKGKNLACFCKEGKPCHADVLLAIANDF